MDCEDVPRNPFSISCSLVYVYTMHVNKIHTKNL